MGVTDVLAVGLRVPDFFLGMSVIFPNQESLPFSKRHNFSKKLDEAMARPFRLKEDRPSGLELYKSSVCLAAAEKH